MCGKRHNDATYIHNGDAYIFIVEKSLADTEKNGEEVTEFRL